MTRIPRPPAALALLALAAFGPAACGDDDDDGGAGGGGGGDSMNVYSSLPLQGAQRLQTTAMVNGIKLALEQHDGSAGAIEVNYTSLDDSTAQAGNWTPEATQANAQKVAQDDSSVAYIGEFNSGASAVSIPIMNEVPVAQISPSNTAVGLTSDEPGADKGEPDKYYPTGERNYLRIVPKDTIQGAALATVMEQDGCTTIYILNDKEVYGAGLARNIESSAKEQGLDVAGNEGIDPKAPNFRSQAADDQERRRQLLRVLRHHAERGGAAIQGRLGGTARREAVRTRRRVEPRVLRRRRGRHPHRRGGQGEGHRRDPVPGRVPTGGPEVLRRVQEALQRAERRSLRDLRLRGDAARPRHLRAARRRLQRPPAMIDALFQTKGRDSVLGTYDIDENGDTTLSDYGVYTVKDGELVFDETVKAEQ